MKRRKHFRRMRTPGFEIAVCIEADGGVDERTLVVQRDTAWRCVYKFFPPCRETAEITPDDLVARACVACPQRWRGGLACPSCGEPGEPLEEGGF